MLLVALVLGACGGSGAPVAHTSTSKPASSTGTAPKKSPPPIQVKMAVSFDSLVNTPVYVAQLRGFFRKAGVHLQLVYFSGLAPALVAVKSGATPFLATGAINVMRAYQHHVHVLAVASFSQRAAYDVAMRNSVMKRLHVTASDPLARRLAALKGLKLGSDSPGGVSYSMTAYLLHEAKLVPHRDVTLVPLGGGATDVVALQHGQIDAFGTAPPFPEEAQSKGFATVLIPGRQIPAWSNLEWEAVAVSPAYAKSHAQVVREVVGAIARADALVHAHPGQITPAIQAHFSKINPGVVKTVVQEIAQGVPADGRMSQKKWQATYDLFHNAGVLKAALNTSQNVFWTNRYLPAP